MRICYLGDSTHIHDLRFIRKLVEKGYETHVVTFAREPTSIEGAIYHHFPFLTDSVKHSRLIGDFIFLNNIRRYRFFLKNLIKNVRPDVLHAGWIPSHGLVAAVSGFHPFLLMPWGSDILIDPYQHFSSKMLTRFVLKRADVITCDAEHVKKEIVKLSSYPGERIIIFPWGIDLKKFNPLVNGEEIRGRLGWQKNTILIMTRNFEPIYGVEYFLKALPEIVKKYQDVRVILCGGGTLRQDLIRMADKLGISSYVHFPGFVKNEDLPRYLGAADVYVSTSLSDGTSLSLLEAMACGLPVVVTDMPAIREWIADGQNGFLIPVKNSSVLAEKIIEMLKNTDKRRDFGERNLAIARERADWDKNFEKLEMIYQQLTVKRII